MIAKSQMVQDYIEKKIMLEEWKPGSKIPSENSLCIELNVSRVSVRSGIEALLAIGLLKKIKFGGTYVSEYNDENYLKVLTPTLIHNFNYVEMLELRQAIDVLCVELCLKNIDKSVIEELSNLLVDMENYKENEDFFLLDRKFHLTISKYTFNKLIHNINEIMWEVLESNARGEYHMIGNDERIVEHTKILNAIISGDIELARVYSKRHLSRTIKDVKSGK